MRRHHVEGPPGTGKTSYLTGYRREDGRWKPGQIQRAAGKHGPDKVLVVALTKAAASEVAARNTAIPRKQIGTLHSLCYRAESGIKLLSGEQIRDFTLRHPRWRLSPSEVISEDAGSEDGSRGLFARYDLLRHQMRPREMWPREIRDFDAAWSDFKGQVGAGDFTDLIERAIGAGEAPGEPQAIFADEAQDFSALELALLLDWASTCEDLVLVGDRLQALYAWRGADPSILDPKAAFSAQVLEQSFRVPAAVHARACRAVRGLPGSEATYRPTIFEGAVEERGWTCRQPEAILDEIMPRLAADESAMVIAPCSFTLGPLTKTLRREGIPYGNPYSPMRNPLRPIGAVRRLLAWLRPHQSEEPTFVPEYTPAEVRAWAPGLRVEAFRRRGVGRARLAEVGDDERLGDVLTAELETAALDAVFAGDPLWLLRHSTAAAKGRASDYLEAVLRRLGPERFYREVRAETKPWPVISTIHGVKGGEADNVVILPDLSHAGFMQKFIPGWHGADALRRLAYVALTRARSRVLIGRPVSSARSLEV